METTGSMVTPWKASFLEEQQKLAFGTQQMFLRIQFNFAELFKDLNVAEAGLKTFHDISDVIKGTLARLRQMTHQLSGLEKPMKQNTRPKRDLG